MYQEKNCSDTNGPSNFLYNSLMPKTEISHACEKNLL